MTLVTFMASGDSTMGPVTPPSLCRWAAGGDCAGRAEAASRITAAARDLRSNGGGLHHRPPAAGRRVLPFGEDRDVRADDDHEAAQPQPRHERVQVRLEG